jgi:hypothetical protein
MAKPPIAADVHEPFDVHGDFLTEITFHSTFLIDDPADLADLFLGEVLHPKFRADTRLLQDEPRACMADAIDIREPDIDPFLTR